jgi:hypothetical protein
MPVALLSNVGITLRQILLYTYKDFENRFEYYERDILPSRIKITAKKTYVKDRAGIFEEKLEIESWSAPQYAPFNNHVKDGVKQRKYKHTYNIVLQIAKDEKGLYSYDSKIRWRVGSFKKVPKSIPQSKVKTIFRETKAKIVAKYNNKKMTIQERKEEIKKELDAIRKKGKYLCAGDYIAMELGINLDNYYRNFYIQNQFNVLYGPLSGAEKNDKVKFPFFCKHFIGVLFFLTKKGFITI